MKVSKKRLFARSRRGNRRGFTLIELTMVILILAIVAGLAVPLVGWLRRAANYGAQANTQAALAQNLEFYRTTYGNNNYPDRMDSLVMTGGSSAIYDSTNGIPTDGGLDTDLFVVGNLDSDQTACLTKWLKNVNDHSQSPSTWLQGNPGNSGTVARVFDGNNVAMVTTASGEGLLLANEIYPNGVPSDVQLVAFGISPGNTAVGKTLASSPLDSRVDNSEVYGRYIAVYATYSPRKGRRAQLKAVLNAKGRTQNNALSEFWQSTNPE